MRKFLFYIVFLLQVPVVMAQQAGGDVQKHLIYFTDKANSPYSVQQPQAYLSPKALERRHKQNISVTARDFPVNPAYVAGVKELGVSLWYTSRWFNAAVVQCTEAELAQLEALPYVRSSQNLNRVAASRQQLQEKSAVQQFSASESSNLNMPLDNEAYGFAFHQANMVGAVDLHAAGYNGKGMTIAVFDSGFPAVNTLPAFSHLFDNKQLKGTFDFVAKRQDVFHSNSHGTVVLSTMAAYEPSKLIGTAYGANYYLFRTEDGATEHNIEEINWLLAAEFADSAGVDVINSSLGYAVFDAPSQSYTYRDMDGKTTLVTRAADYAAATGMLVVTSAGNSGAAPWRYITAPADADSILAVGAVDSLGRRAVFSSFGPSADGRIKPDVSAQGLLAYAMHTNGLVVRINGTSFSSPIVAGMAACLWQAYNRKNNMQMLQLLREIGSNASSPDNLIGYGIPNWRNASLSLPIRPSKDDVIVTNPVINNELSLTLGEAYQQTTPMVHIFDTAGRLLFRQTLATNAEHHTLALPPQLIKQGMYICRISAGDKTTAVRFIKL